MCSFAFLNFQTTIDKLDLANSFQKLRGPDNTSINTFNGYTLLHNLLSITGDHITQPIFNRSGDIALLFNGEIYNYNKDFKSDSIFLLNLYENDPQSFFKKLDGEFSFVICDLQRNYLIVANDIFGTKPVYIGSLNEKIGISSYPSFLKFFELKNIHKIKSNCIMYYSLKDFKLLNEYTIRKFDLRQYKDSYEDWVTSFKNSICKRISGVDKNIFMALSSGYDSGVIFNELNLQNIKFNSYYIPVNEDIDILTDRLLYFKKYDNYKEITIDSSTDNIENFKKTIENFSYGFNNNQCVFTDGGAAGLYQICKTAKNNNDKILISGQGADEIFSDYGILGYDRYNYSTLRGIFPENLINYFPWNNFYCGKQKAYLLKEESICGSFGLEARYPFLDFDVVQEFLYLTVKLKNRRYKAPLDYYLNKYKFPYVMNDKRGFSPI